MCEKLETKYREREHTVMNFSVTRLTTAFSFLWQTKCFLSDFLSGNKAIAYIK